jgi:crossover junction endodeoxyribonuclease RuvC
MRVLGIDPGLTRCGLGVVDGLSGRRVRMVAVGVARSGPEEDIDQRLLRIGDQIDVWLEEHAPDTVAIERIFAHDNLDSVIGVAQVTGIAMLSAARRRIPVALHSPSEVKAAVTGNGRADKPQVQHMVTRLLQLTEIPKPADAADALAIAITHLWRPGGAVGGPQRAPGSMTAAQRAWAEAEQKARRVRA